MIKRVLFKFPFLTLTGLIISMLFVSCNEENIRTKKAVFIILDGISADAIEEVSTPNLDEISSVGGYTRAFMGGKKGGYSQTPTISAVGYNSLLTGTWANKHNVWGNSIKHPNYNYWHLFRVAKEDNPMLKTAVFSTWLDNRTKLVGEGLKETGNYQLDYSFDGFELDTVTFPHTEDRQFISDIDEHVSKEAARYLESEAPDLSWVYLEFTDDMGHKFGDSEQFHEAIELADKQVGRIWKAIQKREQEHAEDWMIVITTDHGRSESDGKGHGGQTERERSVWIVTNSEDTNVHFDGLPSTVDIAPSILRHLKIEVPESILSEMDGVPFIGDIAVSDLEAVIVNDHLNINWKAHNMKEKAVVLVTTTNNFSKGEADEYTLIGKVDVNQEKWTFDLKDLPSKFYKIRLETTSNCLNTWVVVE